MGQAFDEAWQSIAGNFGDDPSDTENARLRLANALLSVVHEDSRDAEVLKRAALEAMALAYREKLSLVSNLKLRHYPISPELDTSNDRPRTSALAVDFFDNIDPNATFEGTSLTFALGEPRVHEANEMCPMFPG
jgi:hypothetical protein